MTRLLITIDTDGDSQLADELIEEVRTAADNGEGLTIRTGGGSFTVEVEAIEVLDDGEDTGTAPDAEEDAEEDAGDEYIPDPQIAEIVADPNAYVARTRALQHDRHNRAVPRGVRRAQDEADEG